jgi:hypothetical protein
MGLVIKLPDVYLIEKILKTRTSASAAAVLTFLPGSALARCDVARVKTRTGQWQNTHARTQLILRFAALKKMRRSQSDTIRADRPHTNVEARCIKASVAGELLQVHLVCECA